MSPQKLPFTLSASHASLVNSKNKWIVICVHLPYDKGRKLLQHLSDMITYIDNNSYLIPNYREKTAEVCVHLTEPANG